jgi:uncharacterized membrane protein
LSLCSSSFRGCSENWAATVIHREEVGRYLSRVAEAGRPAAAAVEEGSADSAVAAGVSVVAARDRVGDQMRTREFLSKLEHDRIIEAIHEAESKTSGEIRVLIERGKLKSDPLEAAQRKFHRLGMHKTRQRNAVLIFVAPRVHKFAVVGDNAIHEKCGDEFWQRVVEKMRMHFLTQNFSDALIEAVNEIGTVLASHFPKTSRDTNELPDDIIES